MRFLTLSLIFFCCLTVFSKDDKIPKKIERSISDLAHYLTRGKSGQKEQARAIYTWITNEVEFDYDVLLGNDYIVGGDPEQILKRKKAVSNGFCELMKAMLDAVKIENETVEGYVHDVAWEPGQLSLQVSHEWMAMKLDGEWMLADPTWDAGFIGRLPINRKPYKPKKYLIPIDKYKKAYKRKAVEEKRQKKEEERIEAYEDKPQYKKKIGFVQDPTELFFAIHPDSFLLDHLPLNPIWQLRSDYISIEDFALSRDSLKMRLANDGGKSLNFESGIETFRSNDYLRQFLLKGDQGYQYNTYNPGIKALNYYNFMYLIHNRRLQKIARGSVYAIHPSKYPVLSAVNDTIIKYTKLYKKFEKEEYKKRRTLDKDKYNLTRDRDKKITRDIQKIEKENEKLLQKIDKNNELIKGNLDKLSNKKEQIKERYPMVGYTGYIKDLDTNYIAVWQDSMNWALDSMKRIKEHHTQNFETTSFVSLVRDVRYIDYLIEYNLSAILFNTYSNNETIEKVDSLISKHTSHAVMLYKDSLKQELIQRNVMDLMKKGDTYVRLSRTAFRELEMAGNIADKTNYETYVESLYLDLLREAKEINELGAEFNSQVAPIIKQEGAFRSIQRKIEKQTELKEEKKEYINELVEKEHERNTLLIERIREKSKKWRVAYKV